MNPKKENTFETKRYTEVKDKLNNLELWDGKNSLTKSQVVEAVAPLQNLELCSRCGGSCCRNTGCSYLPIDFKDMSFSSLKKELEKGYISIIAQIIIIDYKVKVNLFMRTRNVGRPIVDLLSTSSSCCLWSEKGCPLSPEERPSIGILCIPGYENGCLQCHPIVSDDILEVPWKKHQKTLRALVSHFTGKRVKEVIQEQATILAQQFMAKQATTGMLSEEERNLLKLMYNLKENRFIS